MLFGLTEHVGEKYLYGWDDKTVSQWLYEYVPTHISDESVIGVMDIFSNPLDRTTIQKHLLYNRQSWKLYMAGKYIYVKKLEMNMKNKIPLLNVLKLIKKANHRLYVLWE